MIRKAELNDIEEVCDLILMASSCLFEDILKTEDLEKQKELLKVYYQTPNTKFSHDNIIVHQNDQGNITGCLVSYHADIEKTLNETMEELIEEDYSFDVEGIENTTYLDSIAVFEKYQGQGISRLLFNKVIEESPCNLSLLVETYKTGVESYYKKIGFKVIEQINIFNTDLKVMLYTK
ncbi:MAG: GNAT family N-acetyltransferase [Erysipelotrichales bacterium]